MTSPSLMASVVSLKVSDVPSNRASRNVRRGQGAARQNCHLTNLKPRETHRKYALEHNLNEIYGWQAIEVATYMLFSYMKITAFLLFCLYVCLLLEFTLCCIGAIVAIHSTQLSDCTVAWAE